MSVAGTTNPKGPRPQKILMTDGSFLFAHCGAPIVITTPPTKLWLNSGGEDDDAIWGNPNAGSYATQQYGTIFLNASGEIITTP